MTDWQRTLDVSDVWDQVSDGEISVPAFAGMVATRLKRLKPFADHIVENEKLELVDQFESMSEDSTSDFDDFDLVWNELYEWGDTSLDNRFNGKKVCWIKIF
jgi:hypothetical protein